MAGPELEPDVGNTLLPHPLEEGPQRPVFHEGARQPAQPAAPEVDPTSPRDAGYRIPRVVVDLCAAAGLYYSGMLRALNRMSGSHGSVQILSYHRVGPQPDEFLPLLPLAVLLFVVLLLAIGGFSLPAFGSANRLRR